MAVIINPSGSPAWERVNTHIDYGGNTDLSDFGQQVNVDDRTDISAAMIARIADLMAAIARVAPWAKMNFTTNNDIPGLPTMHFYRCMAGSALPTITRIGDEALAFTWLDSYKDAYGVSGEIDLKGATMTNVNGVAGGSNHRYAEYALADTTGNGKNNRVTFHQSDMASTTSGDQRFCVEVF